MPAAEDLWERVRQVTNDLHKQVLKRVGLTGLRKVLERCVEVEHLQGLFEPLPAHITALTCFFTCHDALELILRGTCGEVTWLQHQYDPQWMLKRLEGANCLDHILVSTQ